MTETEAAARVVLFNSFETARDTAGWQWNAPYRLSVDTPPNGGQHSLLINTVPVDPVATLITKKIPVQGYYMISCWGKTEAAGGYIQLSAVYEHEVEDAIQLPIMTPEWQPTHSPNILFCRQNSSLMLTVHSSAVLRGSILIDMLEIRRMERVPGNLADRIRNRN